jgi:hypothetical protein
VSPCPWWNVPVHFQSERTRQTKAQQTKQNNPSETSKKGKSEKKSKKLFLKTRVTPGVPPHCNAIREKRNKNKQNKQKIHLKRRQDATPSRTK